MLTTENTSKQLDKIFVWRLMLLVIVGILVLIVFSKADAHAVSYWKKYVLDSSSYNYDSWEKTGTTSYQVKVGTRTVEVTWGCGSHNEDVAHEGCTSYEEDVYETRYEDVYGWVNYSGTDYYRGNFIEVVEDENPNKYPRDSYTGGYWYVFIPKPYVTSAVLSSSYQSGRANLGSTITLTYNIYGDLAKEPIVEINGVTITPTKVGTVYTAKKVLGSGEDGEVTFSVSNLEDVLGQVGITHNTITSGGGIIADTTPPTAVVSISSDSPIHPYVYDGHKVTITAVASEQLRAMQHPQIFNGTKTVSGTYTPPTRTFTGTYTIVPSDPEMRIKPRIILYDMFDNVTVISDTTDGTMAEVSRTPPEVSNVQIVTTNVKGLGYVKNGDTVNVTFKLNKPSKTIPKVTIGNKTVDATESAGYSFRASAVISGEPDGKLNFSIFNVTSSNKTTPTVYGATTPLPVVDNKPPVVTKFGAENVTKPGSSYISSGDTVRLYMITSEPVSENVIVRFGNQPATTLLKDASGAVTAKEIIMSGGASEGEIGINADAVTDRAGNKSSAISGYIDSSRTYYGMVAPKVSSATIITSTGNQTVGAGDSVTLEVTLDRAVSSQIKATIAGITTSMTKKTGNTYTASRTVLPTDTEGTVSFRVSDIYDSQLNRGQDVTTTTDGSKAVISLDRPKVLSKSAESNNLFSTARAVVGDQITLRFRVDRTLQLDPVVKIGAGSAQLVSKSGNDYVYRYTVREMDIEGLMYASISELYSVTGVPGTVESVSTGVVFDKTPPTIDNIVMGGTLSIGSQVFVDFKASEQLRQAPSVSIAGAPATVTLSSGVYRASVTVNSGIAAMSDILVTVTGIQDLAGNTGPVVMYNVSGSGDPITSNNKIVITLSGVVNGGSYSGTVIPVFSASSLASNNVTTTATLNGSNVLSGKPVSQKRSHTLVISATDSEGNTATLTATFVIN